MLCVLPAGRAGFVCGSGGYDPRNRRQIAMLLASPGRMGCGWDATVGFRPSGAFMLSQRDAAQLKLIMKICLLPDARRTHWNRAFTASGRPLDPGIHCSERTESGVS
jgi:hypothetical protein